MKSQIDLIDSIRAKVDHPATLRELVQKLRVPREERASFTRRIKALVESGALIRIRGNRYGLPDLMHLVTGRVQMNPRGFGFVVPDHPIDGLKGDIYIAGTNLNQALHGDRVVVRLEREREPGRAEGRIIRILERSAAGLVGRYEIDGSGLGYVVPFDRRVIMDVQIPRGAELEAEPGEMVAVELTRWPSATRNPVGRVTEVLGDLDTPGVDTLLIIRKYGIPDEHDEAAVTEARRLGATVHERDLRGRTDFRRLATVTIDGETARDFDDAVTLERLPNRNYWLGVHIADVAHYVGEGSALDSSAYERGTSVYFPERAVHMFPEALATGLCSLNPHVDRLVQSCLMEIDRRGDVVRYEFHDGVINSDARMTYTDVNALLTEQDAATIERYQPLVALFTSMAELYEILRARRRQRGSIDFDLKETELIMDEAGLVEEIVEAERNVAHRIIEELMLVANETVAHQLDQHDVPVLFRVHEPPDPIKVAQFEAFTTTLGYSLAAPPDQVKPVHFQRLLDRLHGQLEEKPVAFLMLRTMQKARYEAANLGHFGLAAPTYTHFTSPIRRYPDLVVHRVLREFRTGRVDEERRQELSEELPEVARYTSEMERRAEDAERELVQWKKVRFMADKVGDEFTGYVTGVAAFGLFVELIEHFVEGLVHVSSMADDYYRYMEREHALKGENTKKAYRLGDKVHVQVVRVDGERRQIDLALVDVLEAVRRSSSGGRSKRSRMKVKRERQEFRRQKAGGRRRK